MLKNILKILQYSRQRGQNVCGFASYGQTELDLKSHSCTVSKQKSLFLLRVRAYSFQATHALRASNNNFPNAILFDCKQANKIQGWQADEVSLSSNTSTSSYTSSSCPSGNIQLSAIYNKSTCGQPKFIPNQVGTQFQTTGLLVYTPSILFLTFR